MEPPVETDMVAAGLLPCRVTRRAPGLRFASVHPAPCGNRRLATASGDPVGTVRSSGVAGMARSGIQRELQATTCISTTKTASDTA